MAQNENETTVTTAKASLESYPFVTDVDYTNTENREYVRTPLSDPDVDTDTEEDVTDEVRAARAQVENTRAELTGTIDALKEKLSPANLVAEAKEATIGAAQNAVGEAVESAKEVAHTVVDTAKEMASNAASVVKEVASNVATSLSGAADSAKSAVSDVTQDAGEIAKNAVHNVKEVSHSAGNSARGAGATIVETIRLNPIPAAITGIGLGWLIMSIRRQNVSTTPYGNNGIGAAAGRFVSTTDEFGQNNFATSGYGSDTTSRIDAAKEKLGDVKDSVAHHASDLASSVSDKASGLANTVGTKATDIAHTVSDKASDLAHTVGDKASAFGGQAKDTAQSAVSATSSYISDNPLAAGAIALLIGVGVGLLIPATEKENQLLGETRDKLKDQAAEQLHQVADKVTSVAQTAFDSAKETVKETVKTEAQNQGLTGAAA
jgi:ElaB/YqjD/DUF883 family membrane-anchored ribosome-binding protein